MFCIKKETRHHLMPSDRNSEPSLIIVSKTNMLYPRGVDRAKCAAAQPIWPKGHSCLKASRAPIRPDPQIKQQESCGLVCGSGFCGYYNTYGEILQQSKRKTPKTYGLRSLSGVGVIMLIFCSIGFFCARIYSCQK